MKIILNEFYKKKDFIEENISKQNVVLRNVKDIFDKRNKTHFVIDKEGNVFQNINPDFWFYFLDSKKDIDKKSIFIGLLNEGELKKTKDNKFLTINGKQKYNEEIFVTEDGKYFAVYKECQIKSLINLLQYLFDKYPLIDKFFSETFDYSEKWFNVKGVLLLSNISKETKEPNVSFPLEKFGFKILKLSREEIMNFVKVITVEILTYKQFKKQKREKPLIKV